MLDFTRYPAMDEMKNINFSGRCNSVASVPVLSPSQKDETKINKDHNISQIVTVLIIYGLLVLSSGFLVEISIFA